MRAFRALEKGSELPTAPAFVVSFVPSPGAPGSGRRDAKTARVWSNLPAVCKVDPGKNQALHVPAHEQRAGHARGPLCTSVSLSAKRGTPLAHFSAGGITQIIHQRPRWLRGCCAVVAVGVQIFPKVKTPPGPQPQGGVGRVQRGRWGLPGPSAQGRPRPIWLWPQYGPSTPADPQGPGQTVA